MQGQGITKKEIEELTAAISALNASALRRDDQSQQAQQKQLNSVKQDLAKLQATLDRQEALKKVAPPAATSTPMTNSEKNAKDANFQPSPDRETELDRLISEWNDGAALSSETKQNLKDQISGSSNDDRRKGEISNSFFRMPDTAKGYTSQAIRGVKNSYCPPEKLKSGVPLTGGFELTDSSILNKTSPIIMTVSKIHGPYSQSQIDYIETPLSLGVNSVTSTAKLAPGDYDVSYGYYLLERLSGEYPPFYSKRCNITIQ